MSLASGDWEESLRDLTRATAQPCVLVARKEQVAQDPRSAVVKVLCERVVSANPQWCNLCEYDEYEVVGRSFSQIPGFQGALTTEASKLRLASLLVSEQKVVEGIQVVNYTGRRRQPLELDLRIDIFKQHGSNAFFLCSIMRYREVHVPGVIAAPALKCQVVADAWQSALASSVESSPETCVLVFASKHTFEQDTPHGAVSVLREHVGCASQTWYDLYQYEAFEVVGKGFSSIRGFQGPLTTEESKLRMASLLISEACQAEEVRVVNYTGRSGLPVEFTLRVHILQRDGWNEAFVCEVIEYRFLDEDIPTYLGGWSRQSSLALSLDAEVLGDWSRQTTAATHADFEGAQRDAMGPLSESPSDGVRRRRACSCQA